MIFFLNIQLAFLEPITNKQNVKNYGMRAKTEICGVSSNLPNQQETNVLNLKNFFYMWLPESIPEYKCAKFPFFTPGIGIERVIPFTTDF